MFSGGDKSFQVGENLKVLESFEKIGRGVPLQLALLRLTAAATFARQWEKEPSCHFVLYTISAGLYLCLAMSLAVNLTPSGRALVGNPIKLSVASDGIAFYRVLVGGDNVFTGSGPGAFSVFLGELIQPYLAAQLSSNDDQNIVIPITGQMVNVVVEVWDDDNTPVQRSLSVYWGGVSKQTVRSLGNRNIFTVRFMNVTNFFFTSRGTSSLIKMKETEIAPLPMIVPANLQLKCGEDTYTSDAAVGSFAALNLSRLRAYWQTRYGYIPGHFDVFGYGGKCCSIVFDPSPLTKDAYLVRFLDSLGCYCVVEFRGLARQGIDSGEDATFQKYDELTDSFEEARSRIEAHPVITMNTGYQTESELMFLQELLQSEDVTLLSYRGADRKVTATCDGYEVALSSFSPGSLVFDFRFVDADVAID